MTSALDATTVGSTAVAATEPAPVERCVLVKVGEIVLKGRNREMFERRLHRNIRHALRDVGRVSVWQREGVIVLRARAGEADIDEVARRLRDVIGVVRVHPALRVPKTPEAAVSAAIRLLAGRSGAFAVRARRRDKRFPMSSTELATLIGTRVQEAYGLPVNLDHPDVTVFVEVDQREVFVFTEGWAGQSGLPVGVSGRAVSLMSGGIDSPVAAYRMMRRGLRCDFLHFSGIPQTGPESIYKAYGLASKLDTFQGESRLWVVPFGKTQQRLTAAGAERLQVVAQRRLMLRVGAELARRLEATALVTGDSLGQVSSQTLPNITALDDAVPLPILRPLIGWDKNEIIAEARRLDTLDISNLPDEDCCTLLTPRRAETRASIDALHQIERRMDVADAVEELVDSAREYRPGEPVADEVTPAS